MLEIIVCWFGIGVVSALLGIVYDYVVNKNNIMSQTVEAIALVIVLGFISFPIIVCMIVADYINVIRKRKKER